jgi:uncharacterized surface protein with fasciclin (FAS1) repeats
MNDMTKRVIAALMVAGFATAAAARGVAPGKPGPDSIVDIALSVNAAQGEFDYLLAAVGCLTAEDGSNPVVDLLSGSTKYTLFAPTDAAFEALQQALGIDPPAPDATCALGDEAVLDVLAYHVTDGRRFSNSVFNRKNPKALSMLNGGTVTANPNLTLTDAAGQSVAVVPPLVNINASNGVIHVVDKVLLPFAP